MLPCSSFRSLFSSISDINAHSRSFITIVFRTGSFNIVSEPGRSSFDPFTHGCGRGRVKPTTAPGISRWETPVVEMQEAKKCVMHIGPFHSNTITIAFRDFVLSDEYKSAFSDRIFVRLHKWD
jgi:hypothetical protein